MSKTEQRVAKPTWTLEEAVVMLDHFLPVVYWREFSPLTAPRGNRVCIEAAILTAKGVTCSHSEVVPVDDRVTWLGEYAIGRARHRVVQWLMASTSRPE